MIDAHAFATHVKGKPHKRRLHALKTDPYTIEESERAAGMGSYQAPNRKRKMETMLPKAMTDPDLKSTTDILKRAKVEDKDGDANMN